MTTFQIIIRKFWIRVEKPIWSFIVNLVFWIGHLNKINETRKDLAYLSCALDIADTMRMFKWTEDSLKDWTQWPSTLVYKELNGDCDDAASLAKLCFKKHGIKADILNLYNSKEGHTICVTRDRTKMVSNERVVDLNPATWESDVMQYFRNKYEVII